MTKEQEKQVNLFIERYNASGLNNFTRFKASIRDWSDYDLISNPVLFQNYNHSMVKQGLSDEFYRIISRRIGYKARSGFSSKDLDEK